MNTPSAVAPVLNPPVRILMGPGPSDIHPRVLQAMGKGTIGHLDHYYLEIMNDMQRMLQALLRTKNPMTLAISGTQLDSDTRAHHRESQLGLDCQVLSTSVPQDQGDRE